MLKIIDVDWVKDSILALTFNDGFEGEVDLSQYFSQPPFSFIKDFKRFSLTPEGSLNWNGHELSASNLRSLSQGAFQSKVKDLTDVEQMEEVIKQASWDSMQEGRPDILQAAIRSYVELFGHSVVIARAGIKSRTSAYRSLKPETKPNFATLVQLAHAVIELAKERIGETQTSVVS
jgi:DNA-binding phage protein